MKLDGFGRIAMVTGAAQGIGKSIALELLNEGKKVVFLDKNKEGLNQLACDPIVLKHPNKSLFITTDVTKIDDIHKSIETTLDQWGRIDILINNAGIRKETKVEDITYEEWEHILSVNLTGTFLFSQAVVKVMKKQKWGRIINISSFAGQYGPLTSGAHYSASKAGQLALTKVFAREFAKDGITVNAIAPALVRSPEMEKVDNNKLEKIIENIPVGRVGEVEEISKLVSYFTSDSSIYVTGATFDINGGMLMR